MVVKIRLARGGAKKKPHYFLVAADSRNPRDGRFLEKLGFYCPLLPVGHERRLHVDVDGVQKWLSLGAQLTDRVSRILEQQGVIPVSKVRNNPTKAQPKKKKA